MTATLLPPHVQEDGAHSVVLYDVSWELYEALVEEVASQNIRITYDQGALEIMPPRSTHEAWKKNIGGLIELMSTELNIPMRRLGSTTFKRKDLAKGVEPDECYYIQHERDVRGVEDVDLKHNPPPDLVIEVDVTNLTINKRSIYAAMGVLEVWHYHGETLESLHLHPDKTYHPSKTSLAFPFLDPAVLLPFLHSATTAGQTAMLRSLRDWIIQNLAAR